MIGTFGKRVFETSDKRILTFIGFTRNTAARFAYHEIIGKKTLTEYVGPGLDTISFTINLNARFGVNVRNEMNEWVLMATKGEAYPLIIGNRALGTDLWIVQGVGQAWNTVLNQGELISGALDITLEEYISRV